MAFDTVVGYANDAEIMCENCARARYGSRLDKRNGQDNEGNPFNPIFESDENPEWPRDST